MLVAAGPEWSTPDRHERPDRSNQRSWGMDAFLEEVATEVAETYKKRAAIPHPYLRIVWAQIMSADDNGRQYMRKELFSYITGAPAAASSNDLTSALSSREVTIRTGRKPRHAGVPTRRARNRRCPLCIPLRQW